MCVCCFVAYKLGFSHSGRGSAQEYKIPRARTLVQLLVCLDFFCSRYFISRWCVPLFPILRLSMAVVPNRRPNQWISLSSSCVWPVVGVIFISKNSLKFDGCCCLYVLGLVVVVVVVIVFFLFSSSFLFYNQPLCLHLH